LAQWRCQKNAIRSTNGFVQRTIWSTQLSTRSVSSPVGSSALPSRVPGEPATPAGAESSHATASATGLPAQLARSAALGPKPARQNRRSTMAGLIEERSIVSSVLGAVGSFSRCRRGRPGLAAALRLRLRVASGLICTLPSAARRTRS
jgi:hypothetical protein